MKEGREKIEKKSQGERRQRKDVRKENKSRE